MGGVDDTFLNASGNRSRTRWQAIAAELRDDIVQGRVAPGERLPNETLLSNIDRDGVPVEAGVTLFAADAVQLTVGPEGWDEVQ